MGTKRWSKRAEWEWCLRSVLQGPWDHFHTLSLPKWPLTRSENWSFDDCSLHWIGTGSLGSWMNGGVGGWEGRSELFICVGLCLEVSWTLEVLQGKLIVLGCVERNLWLSFIWSFVALLSLLIGTEVPQKLKYDKYKSISRWVVISWTHKMGPGSTLIGKWWIKIRKSNWIWQNKWKKIIIINKRVEKMISHMYVCCFCSCWRQRQQALWYLEPN